MKKTFRFLALGVMLIAGALSSFAGTRPTDGPADGDYVGSNVSGGVVNYVVTGWDATNDAYTVQIDGLDYDGLNPADGEKITSLTIKTSFSQKWKTYKYNFYVEKIIDTDATQKKAFYAMTQLTSLTFESDETAVKASDFTFSVGAYSFYGCTKLATLTLPDNVNKIGARAFQNTAITDFVIPAKCTEIGANAFYNTQHLATVSVSTAGNAVMTKIGKQVFGNSSVHHLNLSNATALTTIDDEAFMYELSDVNYQLQTVTLPDPVAPATVSNFTTIGTAFANCTGLTAINNLAVSQVKDVKSGAFENDEKLTVLDFPATAELQNDGGVSPFKGCKKLETLTFADGWAGLIKEDIYYSAGLTPAQQKAELGYLKKIWFKGRVLGNIYQYAFGDAVADDACSSLATVQFDGQISQGAVIGKGAFQNCAALATLTFAAKEGVAEGFEIQGTKSGDIIIGQDAFKGTAIAAVDFKGFKLIGSTTGCGTIYINGGAFACDNLASVNFGKITYNNDASKTAAVYVKDGAFVSDLLTSVVFGDVEGVNGSDWLYIGDGARVFAPATETSTGVLTSVTFGNITAGNVYIDDKAFSSEALTSVIFGNVTTPASVVGSFRIDPLAFGYVKKADADSHAAEKTVKIGNLTQGNLGVLKVTIDDGAFYGDKLQKVTIGEIAATQATIGTATASLTGPNYPAFGGDEAAKTVAINGITGDNVTINQYAFYGKKLQKVLIGKEAQPADGETPATEETVAAISGNTVLIQNSAFAGEELATVAMGNIISGTSGSQILFAENSFANVSKVADEVAYDETVTIGDLASEKLTIKANAFQGPQYKGSSFTVTAGNVTKAPTSIEGNAFKAPAEGTSSYTMGDVAAGTFANVAANAFIGSDDADGNNVTDVTMGKLASKLPNAPTFTNVNKLTVKSWDEENNFWRFDGVRIFEITGKEKNAEGQMVWGDGLGLNKDLYGDGTMNTIEEIYIGGDVTASTIASFGEKVRKVMFTKDNAKIPAGVVAASAFKKASDNAKNNEKIVVRYFVDEDNAILSNQIFNIQAFGGDDAYTNVDLYCSTWQKANTFENTDIIGAPGHIYRMQFSSSDIIPGEDIVASATVQQGGKYAYGRLYIPAGTNNYYRVDAKKTDGVNTVNVFSATVDGEDIYMKPVDIQDGFFWIDATAADQVFIVRTSNISGAVDNKVDIDVESVSAEEAADFEADGGYFFDASDAKKNALQYVKQTIINTELQNTAPYKDKGIYVMANPKTRGLAFAKLDQFNTARDLTAGNVYVLTKKTSAARLNVIFEGDDEGEATAIKSIENKKVDSDAIYNLQGVRVNNAEKGIFIINGKKVVK